MRLAYIDVCDDAMGYSKNRSTGFDFAFAHPLKNRAQNVEELSIVSKNRPNGANPRERFFYVRYIF